MRILITEEALQSGTGHWLSYIGDIATGLRSLGDQVDVAVHQEATAKVLDRIAGTPWFSRNCWVDPKSQGGVGGILHNFIFRKELLSWIDGHAPYDWICAFTMRLQHLLAFALLARSGAIPRKTRFFLLFVQGFGRYVGHGKPADFQENASTKLARFCFWLLSPAVRSGRVVLAAETQGMQDELQRFTGCPVTLAPHPVHFPRISNPSTLDPRPSTAVNPWNLVLLGDGAQRSELEKLRSELGLADCVEMPGFKQYEELPSYYAHAGAFIHASTTEQWGLVVNEAMASSLPVLVSNRCGCAADLVREGENGWTFDPTNEEQIADLMLRIASDETRRKSMGLKSREIIAEWGPDRFASGVKSAVEAALAAPRKKAGLLDRLILKVLTSKR